MSAADLERVGALLRDDRRRAEFLQTLDALAAAQRNMPAAGPAAASPPAPATAGTEAADATATAKPAAPPAPTPGTSPSAAPSTSPGTTPNPAPAGAPAGQAAEPIIVPDTIGAQVLYGLADQFKRLWDALLGIIRTMADLPALWTATRDLVRDPVARARILDAAWKLLLLLGAGLLVEVALRRALAPARRRLEARIRARGAIGWMRRLVLATARLALHLSPIAGFGLVVFGLFSVVQPLPTTLRVGTMAANVYMAARAGLALAAMLLSPDQPALRLIRFSDAMADDVIRWLRRIAIVGVAGYALSEAGLLLGLPWAAHDAIINLTLLLISLFLVRLVLRQRQSIAAVLRAPALAPDDQPDGMRRLLRAARDRLAEVWHIVVILWLLAGWGVWALALENGFQRLLSGTLATVVVLGLAKLVDELLSRLLIGALRPGPDLARRYPGLEARAAFYAPVLRSVISAAVGFSALLLLLQTWGLDALGWFEGGTLGRRLLETLLTIGVTLGLALVLWEMANTAIRRRLARLSADSEAARSARVRTLLPMLRTVIGVVILVVAVLSSLAQLGVNVAPLLAGAGVVGLAVGFGSQTLVRDVITGGFLLLEDAVAVGDTVQLSGLTGVVEHLSIRSIKLRSVDGSVHYVPFSAVTTVTNMTRDFAFAVVDVTVGYDEDTDKVASVLREVAQELRGDAKWRPLIRDDLDVLGVERLAEDGVVVRARMKTDPMARWSVGRELNRRIKRRFEEQGIDFPAAHQKPPAG